MSVAATLQRLILEHNIQNAVFFLLDTCSIYKEGETFLYTVLHCAKLNMCLDGKSEENLNTCIYMYYSNNIRVDYGTFEIFLNDSNTSHFSRADF